MEPTCLLAIIEVPYEDRVRCMANGCGHSVYKQVHIIRHKNALHVYGSTCFAREFHGQTVKNSKPQLTSSVARILSLEERQLLTTNTEQLIQQFESEHAACIERAAAIERTAAAERERVAIEHAAAMERYGTDFQPEAKLTTHEQFAYRAKPSRPQYSSAERASIEPEARQLLNLQYPDINFDEPGFNGLLQARIDRILGERKA